MKLFTIRLGAMLIALMASVIPALTGKVTLGAPTCTQAAPAVVIDNNWAWGGSGSWGLPGQKLTYAIAVRNYDVGCASSSFVVSLSAPAGFTVSLPTTTITLKSYSTGYLTAYVTSPATIADGNYPLTATVQRTGASAGASAPATSYYKVYSTDTTAPTLFWSNPADGGTISGRSYTITVSSSDDHAVQKIELYIDNVYRATAVCDNVTYICQLDYKWSLRGVKGQHTATFKSYDWKGNVGIHTATFTVN